MKKMKNILKSFNYTYFVSNKIECIRRYISGCAIRKQGISYQRIVKSLFNIKGNEIPFFDLNVNNVCSLRCKKCDQGMPYFNRRKMFAADEIISNMNNLFRYVDYVYQIGILGGEPFLNKDLDKVIEYCCNSKKIGSIIVVTNGTIYPSEKILKSMRNKKLILGISWYPLGDISKRIKLIEYCKRHNINFHVRKDNWLDFGDFRRKRNYVIKEKRVAFNECFLKDCVQFNEGYLFRCTKSRLLLDQKINSPLKNEYIKIDSVQSRREMKIKLRKFYSLPYLSACDYCNYGEKLVSIPLGEQL